MLVWSQTQCCQSMEGLLRRAVLQFSTLAQVCAAQDMLLNLHPGLCSVCSPACIPCGSLPRNRAGHHRSPQLSTACADCVPQRAQGQAAVQALARQTRGSPPSPARLPPAPQRAARPADELNMRPPPGARRYMPDRDITPPSARGSGPPRAPGTCTIWVGKVSPVTCRASLQPAVLAA